MNRCSALVMVGFAALAIAAAGCSAAAKKGTSRAVSTPAAANSAEESQAQGGSQPTATVHISYAGSGDRLESLSVRQFTGANLLVTQKGSGGQSSSLVRFDGGAPIWAIQSNRGMLSILGNGKKYAPAKVKYGKVPPGFTQEMPSEGPPAPLSRGGYYVFKIVRAGGATDYEAIRISSSGALQGYSAEPRAGTSYSLCCNVPNSFFGTDSVDSSSAGSDSGYP